ncbi:MAG: D-alanyl-D-alanine carboxypeptidase, partial [Verrucomicrobiales bacterium]
MSRDCSANRSLSGPLTRALILSLLLVLSPLTVLAGTVEEVVASVEKIAGESGLRTALVGFCLIPVDGEPDAAAGYQTDIGMVPASTMKVFTTATANEILGPDYRFVTELQTTGELGEDGTLKGDVVIRGGGDPTLGASSTAELFSTWKSALAEAG